MEPEIVERYVWREEKAMASRVPVVREMEVESVTVKFVPLWICMPMCVVVMCSFDKVAPGAM